MLMIRSENIKLFDFLFINNVILQEEYKFQSEIDENLNFGFDNQQLC